jgi:hypothetical protein
MAVHTWPLAFLIWLFRRVRRRQLKQLDLLLHNAQGQHPVPETAVSPYSKPPDQAAVNFE